MHPSPWAETSRPCLPSLRCSMAAQRTRRIHDIPADARHLTRSPPCAFNPSVNLPPFQALLDAHGRDVHRFLVATVGGVDADDCYQETWLAALRAYPRLEDAANVRAWLFTIAHRK